MHVPQAHRVDHKKPNIDVWLDESTATQLKKFHCSVCGKVLFEYYTNVRLIIPGKSVNDDELKPPTVLECNGMVDYRYEGDTKARRCKTRYHIH